MKKRILSMLLVVVMLLPMFNISTYAASEPTITSHKNGKSYAPDDFYIKWKSVDGANRYRLAVKSLNDGSYAADIWWDDKLTKTKYECDEDDIKPGHRYKIWVAACGNGHDDVLSQYSIEVIAEDECEHDDYDNEVDDIEYEQISGDDTYHYATEYYDRVCNDCGETIKKNIEGDTEKEKHSFSGDKCKKCGYTKKSQAKPSISSASVSPTSGIVNDTKFYFTVKTNKDTTDLLVVSQDGWDITSNYLKDLKSSTSGDTKTWTFWLQMNNINSSYVNIYALNDDGDESSAKKVSFSLSDGVCQHKNYDEYLDDTDYEQISGDDTYHYVTEYYERVCDDCGETIKKNIEGDSEKEKHNFSGDKCKKCGYTKKAQSAKPSISSASVSPTSGIVNDTKFYFTVKTNKDATDLLVVSQDGWDITSNYLKDLKSTTSGDTKTWTFWLQMNNVNSSYVNIYALNDDGNESNAKKVSFSLTTGVCPHKNYDEYLDDTDYELISGDDTYHYATEYYDRVCNDCGETIKKNIEGDTEKEKHSFSGDKCKKCGYTIKTESKPSINSASVSPTSGVVNDTKFKFTVKTNVDTTDLLVKSFDGWDITSDYLKDLKCSTSGSTKTWTFWLQINNVNSSYVNVYALNDNGDESSAKKVSFTVKEAVLKDTTKPQVTKLECENGETFTQTSGYVTFNVRASDNIGVSKIEVYLGNTKLGTENGGSVGFAIPGSKFKVGKNTISAYAYDDAGNKSSAKTITLNIKEQQTISNPSISSASVSPTSGTLNDTKFKFTVKTNKDTTDLLVRAFNGYEITSDYLNDLKCTTSGSTKTWTFWLKINNIDSKYINIYAINDNGDESSAKKVSFSVKEAVVKDTTKPQVTMLECENGETFTQTSGYVTFNAKASDNIAVSKIELYLGNTKLGAENGNSVGFAVLGSKFKVGKNTVSAYAYDDAGNKSSAKTITINIKEQQTISKPSINSASVSPTKGTLNETKFKFTVKTNKDTTDLLVRAFNGYEITSDYLNDLKCTTSGSTKTWTFWLKINNINSSYVNVYAINDDGEESSAKKVSFTVSEKKDTTKPQVTKLECENGTTFSQTNGYVTFNIKASDNIGVSKIELYCGSKKLAENDGDSMGTAILCSEFTVGQNTITAYAYDNAGNKSSAKTIKITIKAVEGKGTPTISSANVSPTKGTLNETQFKFTVKTNKEATDLLVRAFNGYEITSDKLNDLKCTTSGNTKTWTFWLKINNINSSYVNVYALNDNDDESGAKKVSFTVSEPPKKDETAPVIGDITSSAGSTFKKGTSTKITVTVTDENLSEAVLYVNNKKIKNFTSGNISSTLSSLTIGTHNITIKAKDKAGNAAEKSITLTVIDPKAVIPTVEVLSATNITATSATLQGKVTSNSGVKIIKYGFAYDDGTNIQYKWIDGHIDNNKVFTANITGLKPETTYSYQVIAVNENDIEGKSGYMKFTTLEGVAEPKTNNNVIILGVGETKGYLNGSEIRVENSDGTPVAPRVENGRTLIPIRFVSEKLGAKVDWNGDEKKITISTDYGTVAYYWIGKTKFVVNGVEYTDLAAPTIYNKNTFVPLRMLCEKVFGMEVKYVDNGRTKAGLVVIGPIGTLESDSYYNNLYKPHTHNYVSNGNGKHSCSSCGLTFECDKKEQCSVCGYSKPVTQPNAEEQKNNTAKYYEVEQLIIQGVKPFNDYSTAAEKIILEKNTTIEAWKAVANMSFADKCNVYFTNSADALYEEYWELVFAEMLEQAVGHQAKQKELNTVSDMTNILASFAESEAINMQLIDEFSKYIDSSVVYKRNTKITNMWSEIFKKYSDKLKIASYATSLISAVAGDYTDNVQFLVAMDIMVDDYIQKYNPSYGKAMRKAMDNTLLAYYDRIYAVLDSIIDIGEEAWSDALINGATAFFNFIGAKGLKSIFLKLQIADFASHIILEMTGHSEKFSASTKSMFMCCMALHFQEEFVIIGNNKRSNGFDDNDNQYMRNIFELCRAAHYKTYEYFALQYTDAQNQKWINEARNSILGRSIVSYYK